MLNQLEMNTYATTNHNTLFAVPDNKGGDDRNEVDNSSTNKTDQHIRTLVAEMRQLRNHIASVAEVAGIRNDDGYSDGDVPDSGGGDVSNGLLTNPGLDYLNKLKSHFISSYLKLLFRFQFLVFSFFFFSSATSNR